MLILGEKEKEGGLISVRQRGEKDLGQMTFEAFLDKIEAEIKEKSITSNFG